MVRKTVLPNGVRILTEAMPQVVSSSIGIWVENGSRYEQPSHSGVSHFIEHLLFKGTKRRTAAQIAEEIDAVGGVLNAFTSKEYTCYYAKVLGEDLPLATDVLADVFLESVFDPVEIDRERQVVIQEISQAEDMPDDFIHDLFTLKLWEGHPLALPIFGSPETVGRMDRELITSFMANRYRADRIFVAAAGMVDHDRLVEDCSRFFCTIEPENEPLELSTPTEHPVIIQHEKDLEQVHLCLGGPGLSQSDPRRYAAYVLNSALGGGMSSRLFQEVRERRGRVYSIYSFMSSFIDCGFLGIYAGTNREWLEEVIEVTVGELHKIARSGLSPSELDRTKSQLKGSMLLGMESTESRMNRLARNEIYFRREIPLEELARGIEAVTNDQIVELAASFFRPDRMAMVVLGNSGGIKLDSGVWAPLD
jgi:predicted Zn-dependent peptidase